MNSGSWKIFRFFFIFMILIVGWRFLSHPFNIIELAFFCWLVVLFFYPYLILPKKVRTWYLQQRQLHGQQTICFDDESISFQSEVHKAKFKWILKTILAEDVLLLFNTPVTSCIVLRKFCKDDEQFKKIISLAEKLKDSQ